jgi:condensin complex subunit 3
VIHSLLRMAEDLDEDEEMVSPSQIAMQLVDWTDPRRLVDLGKSSNDLETLDEDTSIRNANIHVDLATTIMTHMKKGSSMSFLEESNSRRGGTQGIVQYAGQIVYYR